MDEKKTRTKPGPKATGKGKPVLVRLLPDLMKHLDAWAAEQEDSPSRPEAIRRILTDHFKRRVRMPKSPKP